MGWAPRREQGEWSIANGYSYWSGAAGWGTFDGLFVRWAERQGYAIDLLTQWDLDRDPECISPYGCVVTVGHDEYWTGAGRRALDAYIEAGGRYARLAGNILWQVRIEDSGTTQVCFKYVPELDPLAVAEDHGQRTGAFESLAIGDPPVTTFGANGGRGVYSRMGGSSPRGVGGFIVYRNDHWVFEGSDLYYADVLGATVPLVGYEADGVSYTFDNGLPVTTGEDGAPPELEILALTPGAWQRRTTRSGSVRRDRRGRHAVPGAGAVWRGHTGDARGRSSRCGGHDLDAQGRGRGLLRRLDGMALRMALGEPMVEQIVRNVLDRFSA